MAIFYYRPNNRKVILLDMMDQKRKKVNPDKNSGVRRESSIGYRLKPHRSQTILEVREAAPSTPKGEVKCHRNVKWSLTFHATRAQTKWYGSRSSTINHWAKQRARHRAKSLENRMSTNSFGCSSRRDGCFTNCSRGLFSRADLIEWWKGLLRCRSVSFEDKRRTFEDFLDRNLMSKKESIKGKNKNEILWLFLLSRMRSIEKDCIAIV
ncbi:hypothetical protein AVEN_1445-1 [Araneus ventricosus]|uniref:Uncharacterized protein n=1 Tax=Araneus ventricosus TaxID=182803 RepID=A0A4Y2INJ5_ARAVE|nr:hypothetical protein AVEN_1445-1 [Araneus ventricosus]